MQQDLNNLQNWAKKWSMQFNTSKCNVIFFGSNYAENLENVSYTLNGDRIEVVDSIKYLGVHIADNLKWNKHIDIILNKAYKVLGLIKSSLFNAPPKIKKVAYLTLCRPIIEYASDVWDPFTKVKIHNIEMFQNKALRFILNVKGRKSLTEVRDTLRLEKLENR